MPQTPLKPIRQPPTPQEQFINAAQAGDIKIMQQLLPQVDVNAVEKSGGSALWAASGKNGNIEAVEFLLKNGAKTDKPVKLFPLLAGVASNDPQIVKVLLDAGADPRQQIPINAYDNDLAEFRHYYNGFTPMNGFAGNSEVFKLLNDYDKKMHPEDKIPLMEHATKDGMTPIMSILFDGNSTKLPAVKFLAQAGAKLDMQDRFGRTALMLAITQLSDANLPTVKFLIQAGANLKAKDSQGRTVLDVAKDELGDRIKDRDDTVAKLKNTNPSGPVNPEFGVSNYARYKAELDAENKQVLDRQEVLKAVKDALAPKNDLKQKAPPAGQSHKKTSSLIKGYRQEPIAFAADVHDLPKSKSLSGRQRQAAVPTVPNVLIPAAFTQTEAPTAKPTTLTMT